MDSLAKSRVKATVVTKANLPEIKQKCKAAGYNGITKACLKPKHR